MAEQITDEEIQAQLSDPNTPGPLRAAYEQLSERFAASEKARVALEREAAFAKAGLADVPHRALFEKTYEGEMTADAIREAAKEYGLILDPSATPAPAPQPENRADLEALQRVQNASAGAPPSATPDLMEQIERANSPEAVMAAINAQGAEHGIRLAGTVQGHRLV